MQEEAIRDGTVDPPTYAEALKVWARIGIMSFGGPAGQIALMHRELVEERKWIDEPRYLCCRAPRRCSLPPTSAGASTASLAG
jgi:chromate transporter